MAREKIASSIASLTMTETTMGATPDRLVSFGTLNIPYIAAAIIGMPNAKVYLCRTSPPCRQPQSPSVISAANSSRNLITRLK